MAVRNKKRCSTCPAPKPKVVVQTERVDAGAYPLEAKPNAPNLTYEVSEALKLWKHVLFGTSTCISMIEGYANLQLPGDPLEGVTHLRDRLNQVIQKLES